jgi:hypothetical protein
MGGSFITGQKHTLKGASQESSIAGSLDSASRQTLMVGRIMHELRWGKGEEFQEWIRIFPYSVLIWVFFFLMSHGIKCMMRTANSLRLMRMKQRTVSIQLFQLCWSQPVSSGLVS